MSRWMADNPNGTAEGAAKFFGYDPNKPTPAIIQMKNLGDMMMSSVYAVGRREVRHRPPKGERGRGRRSRADVQPWLR